ncbi:probable E3 ubiquitin-protein ligase RHY1A [Typha latifolia]|uniref:probable E3 ubiquitin-protein ligase RHY1A n=1 Tax=Typha latifolia TaxID=4733 RepID=UPI003C2FD7E4
MTSASELFYNWRSRRLSGPDPNPLRVDPFVSDRDQDLRRNRRRRGRLRRREDGTAATGRSHVGTPQSRYVCHHGSQTIRESAPIDIDAASGSGAGTSSSNEITNGVDRLRLNRTDRLPGAVQQARARLLERLRGISLAGSRRTTSASRISWDDFAGTDVFRVINIGNWETERNWYGSSSPFENPIDDSEEALFVQDDSNKRPPGLSKEALESLEVEVFQSAEEDDEVTMASPECSICLEKFYEGVVLMRLCCGHRFHPSCLTPWLRRCGDCPYCRTCI